MRSIKSHLKKHLFFRNMHAIVKTAKEFFKLEPISFIQKFVWYFGQFAKFNKLPKNKSLREFEYYPCLFDKLDYIPIEPTYFFQDCWAAKHIFEMKPSHHYDVGSSVKTMGIISQFIPTTIVDIRPIELELPNLFFIKGSVLELPFTDNSIESLSSLCVVEHIGLGRYGDPLDSIGSEKAIIELKRVLKIGGVLLFSVPVEKMNKIYFNAHRAFTREYILEQFAGFEILDEKYIYGTKMYDSYDPIKGFGTGLFKLKKRSG